MCYETGMSTETKLTKSIVLRLSEDELRDLDGFCADLRRKTGDPVTRTDTIRRAIAMLIQEGTTPVRRGWA